MLSRPNPGKAEQYRRVSLGGKDRQSVEQCRRASLGGKDRQSAEQCRRANSLCILLSITLIFSVKSLKSSKKLNYAFAFTFEKSTTFIAQESKYRNKIERQPLANWTVFGEVPHE